MNPPAQPSPTPALNIGPTLKSVPVTLDIEPLLVWLSKGQGIGCQPMDQWAVEVGGRYVNSWPTIGPNALPVDSMASMLCLNSIRMILIHRSLDAQHHTVGQK